MTSLLRPENLTSICSKRNGSRRSGLFPFRRVSLSPRQAIISPGSYWTYWSHNIQASHQLQGQTQTGCQRSSISPERLSQSETHSWSPVCQISSVWTSASFFHECHHQNQHFLPTIYLSAKNESMNEVIQIKLNQVKLIHVWNQQPTSNSQSSVYASRSCNLQPLKQDCWCFHVDA